MDQKIVIRILDAYNELMGWVELQAHMRGDGALWIKSPSRVPIDKAGTTAIISAHWCDMNVELRRVIEQQALPVGAFVELPGDWEVMRVGPAAGGLPPVTLGRPVIVSVPLGQMGEAAEPLVLR